MRTLFFLQAAVLAVIAVLYLYFGIHLRYVFTVWWWDIVLHMLGGLWVGLCFAWLQLWRGKQPTILQCAIAAFVIGAGWEIFEYELDIGGSMFMSYQVDTVKDLIDDIIGGVAAGCIARTLV